MELLGLHHVSILTGKAGKKIEKVERYYFKALYFREPNGILFELSTDPPGFATDEPMETMREKLALPPFLEPNRKKIDEKLRPLILY
jgi:glyoxalase family protein